MKRSRRALLASAVGLAGAFAGCSTQSDGGAEGTTTQGEADRSSPRDTATASPETPAYATCNPVVYTPRDDAVLPAFPETLTSATAESYARALEEQSLRNFGAVDSAHVEFGTVSAEAVEHGFVVHVAVEGGGFEQGTAVGDYVPHTTSYFISHEVVRAKSDDGPVDPRSQSSRVVVCRPD